MEFGNCASGVQVVRQSADNGWVRFGAILRVHCLPVPLPERCFSLTPFFFGPVHWPPVMCRKEHEPDHLSRNSPVQQVAHGEEITCRLRHFPALDLQHFIMHPDPREPALRTSAHRLGDFVLVMGKSEVVAATVNVKRLAKKLQRHCRAFDMPARPPESPRRLPARHPFMRRFP